MKWRSFVVVLLFGAQSVPSYADLKAAQHTGSMVDPLPIAVTGSADPTKLTLPCSQKAMNALTKEGFGLNFCDNLKKWTTTALQQRIGNVVAYFYEGKTLDFDTRPKKSSFCLVSNSAVESPTCDLNAHQTDTNAFPDDTSTKRESQNCGVRSKRSDGFCDFTANPFDPESCGKEKAWFNGLRPNAFEHYLEEVTTQINGGEVDLVGFSDPKNKNSGNVVYPCQGYSDAVKALINGDTSGVGYSQAQQILGLTLGVEIPCSAGVAPAPDGVTLALGPSGPSGQMPNINNSACEMQGARNDIETLFLDFATCEVWYRAKPLQYQYDAFANIMADWKKQVVDACVSWVKTQNAPDAKTAMDDFYKCYGGQVKGQLGVQEYFATKMQAPGYQQTTTANALVHTKTIKDEDMPSCPLAEPLIQLVPVRMPASGN